MVPGGVASNLRLFMIDSHSHGDILQPVGLRVRGRMTTMEKPTICRLANSAGINLDTVRYYERIGLMPEPRAHRGWSSQLRSGARTTNYVYDPRLLGRMLATVALRCGTIARIWRANRIAARAANFIETHLETAHAATFVKITAPPKPCAPRAFIFIVCIARHSSHCECEQRQDSYFSHVRFHVLLAAGAALAS
jgi:hypothetical protein